MGTKDTFFCSKRTINCGGKLLFLDETLIMGILNVTPDSFFKDSRSQTHREILTHCEKLLSEGADIIDIGAYSTRPGAKDITVEEEEKRLISSIELIREEFPEAVLSADTFRSEIARKAVHAGASIINDISGGTMDQSMFKTIAQLRVPYILMHIQGTPQTMQKNPSYENVTGEVLQYFSEKTARLKALGVQDVILDPGFGFGKTTEHNYQLLKELENFKIFDLPVLAGVSRKSMINNVLKTTPATALNGTTALNTLALANGANILRVHDVKAAKEAAKIVEYLKNT